MLRVLEGEAAPSGFFRRPARRALAMIDALPAISEARQPGPLRAGTAAEIEQVLRAGKFMEDVLIWRPACLTRHGANFLMEGAVEDEIVAAFELAADESGEQEAGLYFVANEIQCRSYKIISIKSFATASGSVIR